MIRPRILVVDDELLIRDLLYDFFTEKEWDITICESGEKAIGLLRQNPFDVLLTDLKMPGFDGGALMEKARELAPSMPLVIMTGYPSVETAVHALRLRAHDYFVKPFNISKLFKAVSESIATEKSGSSFSGSPLTDGRA